MSSYETTYHRDQTVTIWDVYVQQYIRTGDPADTRAIDGLSRDERDRVLLHCAGIRVTRRWRQVSGDYCYAGGCPDQRCAGGIQWVEARWSRRGNLQARTVWSSGGWYCASDPRDADADDFIRIRVAG